MERKVYMKNVCYYNSYLGKIGIAEENNKITDVFFENDKLEGKYIINETDVLRQAALQLEEYFHGKRKTFSLDLAPEGTDFMKKVWKELSNIPYGQTVCYKDIAIAIGNEKACRAVGMANNRNPIPIFIPCHRVIGKNGALVGYSSGIDIKVKLLELESSYK